VPDVADLRHEKKADISALIEGAVRDMIGASTGKVGEANFARECPRTVFRVPSSVLPFRAALRQAGVSGRGYREGRGAGRGSSRC